MIFFREAIFQNQNANFGVGRVRQYAKFHYFFNKNTHFNKQNTIKREIINTDFKKFKGKALMIVEKKICNEFDKLLKDVAEIEEEQIATLRNSPFLQ